MAIVTSGKLEVVPQTAQQLFCVIRDYMCSRNGQGGDFTSSGLGWEYYDNNFTDEDAPSLGQYFCTRHNLNNSGAYYYAMWEYDATNKLKVYVYADWNLTSHIPNGAYLLFKDMFDLYADDAPYIYIVGDDADDLRLTMLAWDTVSNWWNFFFFGMPDGEFGNVRNIRAVPAGASLGTDVELTLSGTGLPDEFIAGGRVFVGGVDGSTLNHEICEITAVNAATPSITVTLTKSYDTNMMVGTCIAVYALDARDSTTTGVGGPISSTNTGALPPTTSVHTNLAYSKGATQAYNWVTDSYFAEQMFLILALHAPVAIIPGVLVASGWNETFATDEEIIEFDGTDYRMFKSYGCTLWVEGA